MKRRHVLAAALVTLTAGGTAPASGEETTRLEARGHEPEWRLVLDAASVTLDSLDAALGFTAPSPVRTLVDGRPVWTATAGGRRLAVAVDERICADTMTGMPFPVGVTVTLDGRSLKGCAGRTLDVLTGPWRVLRVGGEAPPAGPAATLEFREDGRLAGRAGCNRYMGGFTLTGEGLTFSPLGATRMACPEPAMAFEQRFFEAMGQVTRVTPGEQGRLVLMGGDRPLVVLDRPR